MTAEELVRRTRAAQGLPERVSDAVTLRLIAELLRGRGGKK